ncbi:MAG: hypothetical protein JSU94_19955 [Phycisphaerales bacterium]|nr:MAG: hypothetical protein JSU94_19955 [Phycisphaerales bacterium]
MESKKVEGAGAGVGGGESYKGADRQARVMVVGQICRKGGWGADIGLIDKV